MELFFPNQTNIYINIITLYAVFTKNSSPAVFNRSDFLSLSDFIRKECTKSSSKAVSEEALMRKKMSKRIRISAAKYFMSELSLFQRSQMCHRYLFCSVLHFSWITEWLRVTGCCGQTPRMGEVCHRVVIITRVLWGYFDKRIIFGCKQRELIESTHVQHFHEDNFEGQCVTRTNRRLDPTDEADVVTL